MELEDWAKSWRWTIWSVRERLTPCLSLIRPQIQPYRLHMSLGSSCRLSQEEPEVRMLIPVILTTTPPPTHLYFDEEILNAVLSPKPRIAYHAVTELTVDRDSPNNDFDEIKYLRRAFPNLKTLVGDLSSDSQLGAVAIFKHNNLQKLALHHPGQLPEDLHRFLVGLPSLRELELQSSIHYRSDYEAGVSRSAAVFPSIEVLKLLGEHLTVDILSLLTLPSLKYLLFHARVDGDTAPDEDIVIHAFSDFLSRSRLASGVTATMSIEGSPSKSLFAALVGSIPRDCPLYCNIESWRSDDGIHPPKGALRLDSLAKEIFCADLQWLDGWVARGEKPVKIFVNASVVDSVEVESQRKDLKEAGFDVDVCAALEMEARLRSQVPWMFTGWS
jgi:hypothetical protein